MPLTPQAIAPHIPAHQHICLALSGGVDSMVLLHLLASLRTSHPFTLSAIHVHHGLNPDADQWLDFCRAACAQLNVPFAAERVRVEPKGQGIEAAARAARYAVFAAQPCDAIALAHHQDDQIETFFLAALRGGGIRALAAMPSRRVWQGKTLLRPLLAYSRAEIEAYAAAHGLAHVNDSSNQDPGLLRNWLRHQMLPQLVFRLPHAAAHIQTTIATLQDEHALLNEIIAEDWQRIHTPDNQFSRPAWQQLSPLRRRQMLHRFAHAHALGTPSKRSLADFARVLNQAAHSATWQLPRGKALLHRQILFPLPNRAFNSLAWQQPQIGSLKTLAQQAGLTWQPETPAVRTLSGCLRCANKHDRIAIASGHKNVFQLLQEHGVPPELRHHWAIIANSQNRCIAVANLRSDVCLQGAMLHSAWLAQYQAA